MSFALKSYRFDKQTNTAHFCYSNNGIAFEEKIEFVSITANYDERALDKALFLAFVLMGVSYFKPFPTVEVTLEAGAIDEWQADFFNLVYQEGMSQYAFENSLTRADLPHFIATSSTDKGETYTASDTSALLLQSGGKDSLLLATLLEKGDQRYTPWFLRTAESYPDVLNQLSSPLVTTKRLLDRKNLAVAADNAGIDGHVPISFIVFSLALIQAILLGKSSILAAIGHEGEEPYAQIGDLAVTHQWAKTWRAEQQFSEYISRYISSDITFGSPLRKYSELKIAELFVEHCWEKYSRSFSSCNIGNYKQGQDNTTLGWCGNCAKCANSFLLFAPFVDYDDLCSVFNSQDLFAKPELADVFKGLLGVDGVPKLFECVGEEAELRLAYQLAQKNDDRYVLPFAVSQSAFDYTKEYPMQPGLNLDK